MCRRRVITHLMNNYAPFLPSHPSDSSSSSESESHVSEEEPIDKQFKLVHKLKFNRQIHPPHSSRPLTSKKLKGAATLLSNRFNPIAGDEDTDLDMSDVNEIVENALKDAKNNPSPPTSPSKSPTKASNY
ncbi:hypothetical protein AVEN_265147-1 [Araneus ventricosus]|uniref:Uncharacterized protein n=1 Tax=Araneus ventricosus TaxID=182803 RepID=A0A4Y2MEJ8_ARAVE|nr:hypothetical protein AVEN_93913-1 [Araneus ventricosus]GBN24874.1 hypothetical protein AVEN_265147-1 [Araneus ventricosus]